MESLNVTQIEPRLKHSTIFKKFDVLEIGDSLLIHNDHNPLGLYYQLIEERGQIFDWEYILNGPDIWEVKITKRKAVEAVKTIGELVAADYRKAEVFRKFGIDFCCGGNKTVEAACNKKGVDITKVEAALADVDQQPEGIQQDFNKWKLDFLVDYIVNAHHRYVSEAIPMLYEFSTKVAKVHGDTNPEVIEIAKYYNDIATELTSHMQKEEQILFPYIKAMINAQNLGEIFQRPAFGTIENPIQMMESEHVSAGSAMEQIHELSNNFNPPENACSTYRVLYANLKSFERDLHQHIHLENNILFPKAIALEKELFV